MAAMLFFSSTNQALIFLPHYGSVMRIHFLYNLHLSCMQFSFRGTYHGNYTRDMLLRILESQQNKVTNFLTPLKYKQVQVGSIVTSKRA